MSVEVKHGTRMNEPPAEILESDGHRIVVSEETNRRWLEQEVQSCRETEADISRRLKECEGELSETQEERHRLESEIS